MHSLLCISSLELLAANKTAHLFAAGSTRLLIHKSECVHVQAAWGHYIIKTKIWRYSMQKICLVFSF